MNVLFFASKNAGRKSCIFYFDDVSPLRTIAPYKNFRTASISFSGYRNSFFENTIGVSLPYRNRGTPLFPVPDKVIYRQLSFGNLAAVLLPTYLSDRFRVGIFAEYLAAKVVYDLFERKIFYPEIASGLIFVFLAEEPEYPRFVGLAEFFERKRRITPYHGDDDHDRDYRELGKASSEAASSHTRRLLPKPKKQIRPQPHTPYRDH